MEIPNSFNILQAVIEATPDAIFVKDLEGRYVLVNQAFARFLGRPSADVIGRHDLELYPDATARQFIDDDRRVLATGRAQSFEGVATSAEGTQAYLVTKGVYRGPGGDVLGLYGISHDITELRRAQDSLEQAREALFRSQKMEAVGQLTGGIAHDFNNILAVIIGNIELLRRHLPRGPYADDLIDSILRAALHGRELTAHLLAFSRQRQLNPHAVDLQSLIDGIVRLLGRTLGASVRIETRPAPEPVIAHVDPAALEAALLNIALNARDAMPDGGLVTIGVTREERRQSPVTSDDLPQGVYARIDVRDTGTGMPPDVVARVFEPFFTTKAGGGGTGLGMSMVYGFARQSGGTVVIDSVPGRGTCVTVYLPLSDADVAEDAADVVAASNGPRRTVLVVEDDPAVRVTLARQVESLGHRVLLAGNAADALEILASEQRVDVLLTDVVLGRGLNGLDLAASARAARAGLPVIFISGYTAVPAAQQRIRDSGAPLLSKPATLAQLEQTIDQVSRGRSGRE